nr:immunoglobulin light chain junction region [Macaca mulatta]MPO03166.1 immunoglobulin light chain junction region [Macaca mulatta]MPO03377.1 immunoglobulin light chain junction region [Macaca mulatta]MPO04437.1 immunoglobulin light chain junction region [Macaca mulatta]MPO05449.1 immunoglobulin light chain junction region [Macaca mulatta]
CAVWDDRLSGYIF